MTGVIKSYSRKNGVGFVTANDRDYFFRWNDIVGRKHAQCKTGEVVSFEPYECNRGLRASKVKVRGKNEKSFGNPVNSCYDNGLLLF